MDRLSEIKAALELSEKWLYNCVPIGNIEGPKPLPVLREAYKHLESLQSDQCAGADKKLRIYVDAINQIDDLMEYRGMDKEQFDNICGRLNKRLKELSE